MLYWHVNAYDILTKKAPLTFEFKHQSICLEQFPFYHAYQEVVENSIHAPQ
jgi:hypothetical protein